jgi:hypothetical protein
MFLSCLATWSSLAGLTFDLHFLHSNTEFPHSLSMLGQHTYTMSQSSEGSIPDHPLDSSIALKNDPVPLPPCHFCKSLITRAHYKSAIVERNFVSLDSSPYGSRGFRQGAAAGCSECSLFFSAFELLHCDASFMETCTDNKEYVERDIVITVELTMYEFPEGSAQDIDRIKNEVQQSMLEA